MESKSREEDLKNRLSQIILSDSKPFGISRSDLAERFKKTSTLMELHNNWHWQFESLDNLPNVMIVALPPNTIMLVQLNKNDEIDGLAITAVDKGDDNTGIYALLACVFTMLMANSDLDVDKAGSIIKTLGFLKNMETNKNHDETTEHDGFVYKLKVTEEYGFWFGVSKK